LVTPGGRRLHTVVTRLSDHRFKIVLMGGVMRAETARPEVLVFVIDAGGGHRAAANALVAAAQAERRFRLHVASLQEVLEPLDVLKRTTGLSIEGAYNALLRGRRTRHLVALLRVLQAAIRLRRRALVDRVAAYLSARRPDVVVSVIPNFNGVIRDAVAASLPGVPFVVLLTDFADFPPRFWIEPGVDRLIVGSDQAADQAVPRDRVSRVSGMVLHPRFYPRAGTASREGVRHELQVPDDAFTILVLFGGKGSAEMLPLSGALLREDPGWRVIAVCGENTTLYDSFAGLEAGVDGRLRRLGFTNRVADLMAASDVLVTKPGPGTLAEAFHQQIPAIVTRDVRTIPQERFNARFLEQRGLGLLVSHWSRIPAAVGRMARDADLFERTHANLAALPPNRAVYEAIEVIAAEAAGGGPATRR
jgi:1,2-diacylglycerol 3-beta-galactosyltransferase